MRARRVVVLQVAGVVALAVAAVILTALLQRTHAGHPAPRATSFESSTTDDRAAYEAIAQAHIDAVQTFQTMLHTAHTNGQPTNDLLTYCRTAVADYNATATNEGPYWPTNFDQHLNPDQECTP